MTRFVLLFSLQVLIVLAGCSKQTDTSPPVIIPGVGISNLVEIGMTTRQVQKNAPDLTVRSFNDSSATTVSEKMEKTWENIRDFFSKAKASEKYEIQIPSLGASWAQDKKDEAVWEILFLVDHPSIYPPTAPNTAQPLFHGTVAGGLSFAPGNTVTRDEVTKIFGQPANTYDFTNVSHGVSWGDEIREKMRAGQPVSVRIDNTESLAYPNLGINFALDHNVVYLMTVRRKVE